MAELLAKYGLQGTFYIPRKATTSTMTEARVRELSQTFEIGAHTLEHTELTRATSSQAWHAIVDSKAWVESTISKPCPMFCPPLGRFSAEHLEMIRRGGYRGVRTVEALSLAFPRPQVGLVIMPTTVQAHAHGLAAYGRNLLKRAAFSNIWLFIVHGRSTDWPTLVRSLLLQAMKHGGVFHLWGHSWELEENNQWHRLEEVLRFLSQFTGVAPARTNSQLCEHPQPGGAAT